ncbi:MAG: GatB/YqeY domain-containing protein [Burkholderiaceae bacterium]
MALKDRIGDDMKAAMRARQADRLGAIRLLQAAIKQKEIDERVTLDDTQVLAIVDKLIKQRRDSITQFERAGRTDLVDKEKAEVDVLSAYLPAQADMAQVAAIVDEAIAASGASGPSDMGKVMALVKPRLAGRADMGAVSAAVKQRLADQQSGDQPSGVKPAGG